MKKLRTRLIAKIAISTYLNECAREILNGSDGVAVKRIPDWCRRRINAPKAWIGFDATRVFLTVTGSTATRTSSGQTRQSGFWTTCSSTPLPPPPQRNIPELSRKPNWNGHVAAAVLGTHRSDRACAALPTNMMDPARVRAGTFSTPRRTLTSNPDRTRPNRRVGRECPTCTRFHGADGFRKICLADTTQKTKFVRCWSKR